MMVIMKLFCIDINKKKPPSRIDKWHGVSMYKDLAGYQLEKKKT